MTTKVVELDEGDALRINNAIKCFLSWGHPPELVSDYRATLVKIEQAFVEEFSHIPWLRPGD